MQTDFDTCESSQGLEGTLKTLSLDHSVPNFGLGVVEKLQSENKKYLMEIKYLNKQLQTKHKVRI